MNRMLASKTPNELVPEGIFHRIALFYLSLAATKCLYISFLSLLADDLPDTSVCSFPEFGDALHEKRQSPLQSIRTGLFKYSFARRLDYGKNASNSVAEYKVV